jgi:hypothetical protein
MAKPCLTAATPMFPSKSLELRITVTGWVYLETTFDLNDLRHEALRMKNIRLVLLLAATVTGSMVFMSSALKAQETQSSATVARKTGTVKSIKGNAITLKPDSGADVNVTVQDGAKVMRIAPGQTDLKSATPITLQEIQVGDRMLVRGKASDSQDSLTASSIIVMKQADVTQKQQKDLQDWQRRGSGGIVTAIDAATGAVTVSVNPALSVKVKTTKDTEFLRYAANSVKFSDAQKGSFDQIKVGDQLRARGAKSEDGKELTAEEVISGTFRNIAGTITSIDAAAGTIVVKDVLSKKSVTVKLTTESQMRKLPAQLAQRIAFFLKSPDAAQAMAARGNAGGAPAGTSSGPGQGGPGAGGFGTSGPGGGRPGGAPDFQQVIGRLPAVTISDLQKDEAVMIVSTPGTGGAEVAAITLLSGVEPIITASPSNAAALLSGWNLSAPGGDAGAQ